MGDRPRTALFVTYGGGHVNMMIPVLQKLRERADLRCVTLGLTTAGAALKNQGLPSRGFASLIRAEDTHALRWGEKLAAALPAGGAVPREETVAYLGLSYADLVERAGEAEAARAYEEKGRQAFLPLGPLRRLLDEIRPDAVVATISPRAEEAALRVAGERGIPSLCLVDLFARTALQRASAPGYGTRVAVISQGVGRWLVSSGRPENEIAVTGNPAFDHLVSSRWGEAGRALRAARGWGEQRVILWASQVEPAVDPFSGNRGNPRAPAEIEEALRGITARAGWRLVVRPHPNEPPRRPDGRPNVDYSDPRESLPALLAAVDAVVIMTSTVGLEARFMGKPVISVDRSVFTKDTPFSEEGISQGVANLADLGGALETALATPPKPLAGFPPVGRATEAVVNELNQRLGKEVS